MLENPRDVGRVNTRASVLDDRFADHSAGFATQSFGGPLGNNYFYHRTRAHDDEVHLGICNTDGALWESFLDGLDEPTPGSLAGANTGHWYAVVLDASVVVVGHEATATGPAFDPWPFFGHITEILIYDHPLDEDERNRIQEYIEEKYVASKPRSPGGLTAQADAGEILLDWDDNIGEDDGYNVYRSEDQGASFDKLNTKPMTASEYLDKELTEDVLYTYAVTAVAGDRESGRSDTAAARIGVPLPVFLRGDSNSDGIHTISDASYTLNFLFLGGPGLTVHGGR